MKDCQNVHRNLPVLLKNFATDEAITTTWLKQSPGVLKLPQIPSVK